MDCKRFSAILSTLLVLALIAPALALAEPTEDTEPPQLDSLSFEPTEVDVTGSDQHVTIKAHVIDNVSGSQRPIVEFASPDGSQEAQAILTRTSGTGLDGTYEGVATIHRFAQQGTWKIRSVFIADEVGNVNILKTAQLEADGFPVALRVDPLPSIAAISPISGPEAGGIEVEILGTGLASATSVRFGPAGLAAFVVNSPTSIIAIAPLGSGTVDVAVTTPTGTSETSSADRFRYSPPVSLASSPNPSVRGQKVTFTAKVTPQTKGAPKPLGTVTFVEGSTTLGVASLNSKGTATFSTTTLSAGNHQVVAKYSGDTYFGPSDSSPVTQVVNKATTELTLKSSRNPAPFGSSATLSATVKVLPPGTGAPTGTVIFLEGGTPVATVPLSGKVAKYSLKALPPGTHGFQAIYSGDGNYEPSESAAVNQVITP